MNTFQLKLIAVVTMVVDHVGAFFYPGNLAFRLVGRLSFPLFGWLIANGYRHSKNAKAYLIRLVVLAGVSQIPFLAIQRTANFDFWGLNIFATLGLGLVGIMGLTRIKNKLLRVVWVIFVVVIGEKLKIDYGGLGVLSIVMFHIFYEKFELMVLSQILITFMAIGWYWGGWNWTAILRVGSLLALPVIGFYNNNQGTKKFNGIFYWFYPIHLVVMYMLKLLF